MTKAKPSRKNRVEEADAADIAVEAFFEPMDDAEIDALFEDEEFLEWLDGRINEVDADPRPPVSLAAARSFFKASFADNRKTESE